MQLTEMVAEGIAQIGDPLVTAPSALDYDARPFRCDGHDQSLTVDVDMGGFVLPLCAMRWEVGGDDSVGINGIAQMIVARVSEASRSRRRRAERLDRARAALEAKVSRDGVGVEVVALRLSRQPISITLVGYEFRMEADLRMLDDALQPYVQRLEAWNGREFAKLIGHYVAGQRSRRRHLDRLAGMSAILEIDAIAESAIISAGRRVDEVALELVASCDREHGHGGSVCLEGTPHVDSVSVCLRGGRIVSSVAIPGRGHLFGRELRVDHPIPETIAMAMVGRPATAIMDHPVLRGTASIGAVDTSSGRFTDFKLKVRNRPIRPQELERSEIAMGA